MREAAGGNIYDLGYRHYTGPRLGRPHAVGRCTFSRCGVYLVLAGRSRARSGRGSLPPRLYVPALVQLGVASISTGELDVLEPHEYYTYIQIVLALFVAVVAPELAGRDQRSHTLSLYFSRAIVRDDYALAKYAALVTALLGLTLLPQLLLFLGNGVALDDLGGYVKDQWSDLARSGCERHPDLPPIRRHQFRHLSPDTAPCLFDDCDHRSHGHFLGRGNNPGREHRRRRRSLRNPR